MNRGPLRIEIHLFPGGAWLVQQGSMVVEEGAEGGEEAARKVADARRLRLERLTGKTVNLEVHPEIQG